MNYITYTRFPRANNHVAVYFFGVILMSEIKVTNLLLYLTLFMIQLHRVKHLLFYCIF